MLPSTPSLWGQQGWPHLWGGTAGLLVALAVAGAALAVGVGLGAALGLAGAAGAAAGMGQARGVCHRPWQAAVGTRAFFSVLLAVCSPFTPNVLSVTSLSCSADPQELQWLCHQHWQAAVEDRILS